ncbi:molybdopterin-guanine dinucleotide biosynthesis protein B [Thermodesulfobacterium sp. TA1]|uniref:molybdopterin-guanine dinucleotide biosynthesis protein B n=1 Tax=Thermodesulfobacterium sp. TA1 TaxID=2234087 RepID=UPI001231FAE6|nr:molybdopterin-guanine dinucleotide biosynthesis protein MobB [Thermodesulfobacterium sp. TA1]QER42219.1 molybdopterin-guanine dinucleotide biosynthesis protein B [Thermodesulfobacterium sp. TA1]
MPCFLAISGYSGSGKTTFGSFLVKKLSESGYKVGVVKSCKESEIFTDLPNKDTWVYREQGASGVVLFQENLFTLYLDPPKNNLTSPKDWHGYFLSIFWEYDLVLFEGFKKVDFLSKLWVIKDKDEDLRSVKKEIKNLLGFVVKENVEWWKKSFPEETFFSLEKEEEILNFLKGFIEQKKEKVMLRVNGKKVPLKDFVKDILAYPVLGFVKALKGVPEEILEIEVKIKNQS